MKSLNSGGTIEITVHTGAEQMARHATSHRGLPCIGSVTPVTCHRASLLGDIALATGHHSCHKASLLGGITLAAGHH